MATEIRELDSERQSLVYNHHHELIAASDTITAVCDLIHKLLPLLSLSQMKSRAESLEFDLEKLKGAFSEISRLTAQIASEPSVGSTNSSRNDSEDTTV
ncbi:hypothetical protein Clacol_002430 [Clathrus columnatus]|uniref:Vacuolar protein sorting-associated protein 51 homolog n=1 Tax=Clathrus columnatus TaxID=1419009 RepID=A0AAV5A0P7_9AGAM|nr:hypothetical protein Clacol_002430 [Clathrus columnatus]